MHWKRFGLLGSAAFVGTSTALTAPPNATSPGSNDVVPGAFIVEFTDDYDAVSLLRAPEVGDATIKKELKYELFKGASIQLNDGEDFEVAINNIANLDQVKNIWPVRRIPMPNDTVIWTAKDGNVSPAALRKRQSTNETDDTFSPHVMTQVDRLHAEGITGKGIKIAVVDSGIDYMHPALGGCFGEGCLVSYGADLVGSSDSEPLDCLGHGTHVAGTVAAQKNAYGFVGGAPDVNLGNYRVVSCQGAIDNDVIIAAFNQAYQDGSDIITCSIGGPNGFTDEATAVVAQRIVEAGVPVTISAGNGGASGLFAIDNPAVGLGVSAIASQENTDIAEFFNEGHYTTRNGSNISFGWVEAGFDGKWVANVNLPLWTHPYDTSDPEGACELLPEDTPNLSDFIVLVPLQGNCFWDENIESAAAHGARFILGYAVDYPEPVIPNLGTFVEGLEGFGMVTLDQGLEWTKLFVSNTSVAINIVEPTSSDKYVTTKPNPRGGHISTFSSWGPGNRVEFKPQFSAPGSYILSTYPLDMGGYAVMSGTSMATPLAAAIYALVSQVQGTLDPETITSLLASTAKPSFFWASGTSHPYLAPTAQQGAGLIQAYDAAHSTTLLDVSSISFNDTANLANSTTFTIKNTGDEPKSYILSNNRAATGYLMMKDEPRPDLFPNEMTTEGAELSFSPSEVTVPAGGEVTVTVVPTPPSLDEKRFPVYGGFITLNATGSSDESLSVPYLGTVGSLYDIEPLEKDPNFGCSIQNGEGELIYPNQTFRFPRSENIFDEYRYPIPGIRLNWNTEYERMDLVSLNETANTVEFAGVKIVGSVLGWPRLLEPRFMLWFTFFNGQIEDKSFVPAGGYKIMFRALRMYGDAEKEEDWDSLESDPFIIEYIDGK